LTFLSGDLFEELRDLSQQWRYSARPPTVADIHAAKEWAQQLIAMTGQDWPVDGFLAGELVKFPGEDETLIGQTGPKVVP